MNTRTPGGGGNGYDNESPRKPADFLQPLSRRADQKPMTGQGVWTPAKGMQQLIVPREVELAGRISGCTRLIIDGRVDVELGGCTLLEVNEGGSFRGIAEVETVEVKGTVDGTLTVRGRLIIRASGRVVGRIRYKDLHIEPGGKLAGQVESFDEAIPAKPAIALLPNGSEHGG